MRTARTLLALTSVAISTICLTAAQPVTLAPEFQVNTWTTMMQRFPSIAADGEGGFVVVYVSHLSDGSSSGVMGQRHDGAGLPAGPEFQVNSTTAGVQGEPRVATDAAGNAVVIWMSRDQDGDGFGVYGQRYDSAREPLGPEFLVNSETSGWQWRPTVDMGADGEFAVVWQSQSPSTNRGVFMRRFDSSGSPLGAELQVNTSHLSSWPDPEIAFMPGGGFVVVWSDEVVDGAGTGTGIAAMVFDSAGAPMGAEFQVNTWTASDQSLPAVAAGGAGEFVVVWTSMGADGDGLAICGRRFDEAGKALGGEFVINSHTPDAQQRSRVDMDANGGFTVVWESRLQDGEGGGIFGRSFDPAGLPVATEFQANTWTAGSQQYPAVLVRDAEDFVVVWEGYDQDGDDLGIFGWMHDCADADGDDICNVSDIVISGPLPGATLECRNPLTSRPTITWEPGDYEKFKVILSSDPLFRPAKRVLSSGFSLRADSWTPPRSKWRRACRKVLAANPANPVLYIKVVGRDTDARKGAWYRTTESQMVQVDVTP